jgi:hypothetical protein
VVVNLENRHWERLLADIEGRQVIPVIGPEMLIVEIDGRPVKLYQHLAEELAKRFGLDRTDGNSGDYSFYQVVSEFLEQQRSHPSEYECDEIYYKIREILNARSWPTPEPLRQLASIRHFDLFVSTTFDSLMEQALNEARYGGESRTRSFAYCKRERVVDLPDDFVPEEHPTVFYFFGKVNPMNDFSVTDEDILEYAHRLQSRDLRPHNLFDQFRNKRLLTLGCSFPGWLMRFFLAAAKGEELFTAGVPGFLADDQSPRDRDLVGFLERKKTNVYTQGDAAAFVAVLHRRWMERFGEQQKAPVPASGEKLPSGMEPDSVFISFRNDDRDTARSIAGRFREAGIDVWFDETDLAPGDRYKTKIADHIFKCFAFVPLISKNSIALDAMPWFYRFEWNKAIEAAEFRPKALPFILPIVIDDTSPKDEQIPPEFRDCHISTLDGLDGLVATTRDRLRVRRRGRRTV